MGENFTMIGVVAVAVLALGMAGGAALVIRDTVRKQGRWGINLRPVRCPVCRTRAPTFRRPKSRRQTLWGGSTCEECGTEYDKWGRSIAVPGSLEAAPDVAGN